MDNQAPYPLVFDADGKSIRGKISPAFVEWAQKRGLPLYEAVQEQTVWYPAELSLLATTGDPRGLTVQRKGLSSPNYAVRLVAAEGLAILQDKESTPLIIDAARQTPSDMRWLVALPLVAFNDVKAEAAAEELVTDKRILEGTRARVKEKGPRAAFM